MKKVNSDVANICLSSLGDKFWFWLISVFRDVIMEAKLNGPVGCACDICSHPVPHLHVHKVILQSGCDYLQGLFRSGMQER